ncbi:LysR family transcriptional regulator [Thioalkalivibrio sp.]|uniref:LysR family transcriptional regulator n=1 Tax=Thioalkalivibrio sp. TaxID=2093813 RepID=UPI0025D00273|nr:LysR family transcriptional regulator [Thioalkalivibrio sp.]
MKIVRALASHRNFARAADELGMSQPSLSRALARLEEAIGAQLFERSRTAVTPTDYAEIVLLRCDALIAGFKDLSQALEFKRGEAERGVRVSIGPFAAEAVGLAGMAAHTTNIRSFQGRFVVRDWRTCLEDVLERRSELAITDTRSALVHPELAAERLGGGPVAFFCDRRHPLAQRAEVTWADVMRFPWAMTLMQGRWLDVLPADLGVAGRCDPSTGDFVPAICVDSFAAMTAAVRNGRAISAAPPAFIEDELERGEFVTLPLQEPWMQMDYGLVWRRDQPWSSGLKRFVETLRRTQIESSF